jgi:succinate-semialdehyde dehydrogenase / glutarate-semialdehyde dehydrogenase
MYDNLLAGVPTDLWIGGRWCKSRDGSRFDVFDPATENLIASVNKEGRDKVIELVDDAVSKGAKVLTGGRLPAGPGFFYPATVLVDVPDGAKMLDEEIFGPVASIQRFSSEDEAIRRANDTEYGLVAYVFTRNLARGLRMSERLDFGMIGLNRGLVSDPAAAFGGMKQSGLGREGAHEGMMEFLESQYVSVVW